MKNGHCKALATLIATGVASSALAAPPRYRVAAFYSTPNEHGRATTAQYLNLDGTIAGISHISGGCTRNDPGDGGPIVVQCHADSYEPIVIDGDVFSSLGVLGQTAPPDAAVRPSFLPVAINTAGEVAGYGQMLFGSQLSTIRSFIWLPSTSPSLGQGMHELSDLGVNGDLVAWDINDHGWILARHGPLLNQSGIWKHTGVEWTRTPMLNPQGESFAVAHGLNNLGQVIGFTTFNGVQRWCMWLPEPAYGLNAGPNDLGAGVVDPNLHFTALPSDINDLGQAVSAGVVWLPEPAYGRAAGLHFIDHQNAMTTAQLARYEGPFGSNTIARLDFHTISNHGLVAGHVIIRVPTPSGSYVDTPVGMLYDLNANEIHLLEELLVGQNPSRWRFWGTTDVNDRGQIVAYGVNLDSPPLIAGERGYSMVLDPVCAADFNGSGLVDISDIFMYLNAWFAGDPTTDIDNQDGVTISDIFAFLNAWFAGC